MKRFARLVSSARALLPVLAVLLTASVPAGAADFELTPFAGGRAGGAFNTRHGDPELEPSLAYGLQASWRIRRDGMIELLWSRQDTTLELDSRPLFDLTVDYLQLGAMWEMHSDTRTRPFLGLALGAAHMSPDAAAVSSETFFSLAIYGGVKHFFGERLGVRVEGRGHSALALDSGGLFCGASFGAGGCAVSVEGDAVLQVEGTVGLIVRF